MRIESLAPQVRTVVEVNNPAHLRSEHRATLLSVSRGGATYVHPPDDVRLELGDDAVVVAESLGTLAPLQMDHEE